MAGAYCKFCGRRCFVYRIVPDGPRKGWAGHMATCKEGMAHDQAVTGHTHLTAVNPLAEPDVPLEVLDEKLLHDGAEWSVEDRSGREWVIRWFAGSGNVAAMPFRHRAKTLRGNAGDLEAARHEAVRLAGMSGFHLTGMETGQERQGEPTSAELTYGQPGEAAAPMDPLAPCGKRIPDHRHMEPG